MKILYIIPGHSCWEPEVVASVRTKNLSKELYRRMIRWGGHRCLGQREHIFYPQFLRPYNAVCQPCAYVCEFVQYFTTKWPLMQLFGVMVRLDPIEVTFVGQGHRSKFKVTGASC